MDSKRKKYLFKYSVDLFIEALKQVTHRRNVKYKCNDADVSCWNAFVKRFGDGVGEELIQRFVEYGMQSWFNDGTDKDYSRSIRYSWVFGSAAIKRWFALNGEVKTRCVNKGVKKRSGMNLVKCHTTIPQLLTVIRPAEESYKNAYYNTKRGLCWCVANTTLYHHRSALCAGCNYKVECKETLKNEFPKIYEIRGYGK